MNILDLINSRHSYRGEYESTPVPKEDLIKIMQTGLADHQDAINRQRA